MTGFRDWQPAAETKHRIRLDIDTPLNEARDGGHNRWHQSIAPLLRVAPGDLIALDTRDASDAQVLGSSLFDVEASTNLDLIHPLTGPIYVEGAEPGDLLDVEIIEIVPNDWGWSSVYPDTGGVMKGTVTESYGLKWHLDNGIATSADLPGVSIPARPFIGVIGVAPSEERRAAIAAREAAIVAAGGDCPAPSERFAYPPTPAVIECGLRTIQAREMGGNLDTKDLSSGSRFIVPVDVPGALLSLGDVHMAQGDGESFGTAIETSARILLRCHLLKAGEIRWTPSFPVIKVDTPVPGRHRAPTIMTTGMALTADGDIAVHDITLATQNALKQMVEYLVAVHGLTPAHAFSIGSIAVDLRISVIQNAPSPVVSAVLPLDIFDAGEPDWTAR